MRGDEGGGEGEGGGGAGGGGERGDGGTVTLSRPAEFPRSFLNRSPNTVFSCPASEACGADSKPSHLRGRCAAAFSHSGRCVGDSGGTVPCSPSVPIPCVR